MSRRVFVTHCADVEKGAMKTVSVEGKNVAVAHIGDEFFVVDDQCSHEQCSLGTEGFLDGKTILCGCHGASFDVQNGHVLSLPATQNIASYRTVIENGDVYIERE